MTRVDFYVLPETGGDELLPTACRLSEKAMKAGQRLHIHVPDPETAAVLDKMLWTFRQGSFVAHERLQPDVDSEAPIVLGDSEPPTSHQDVLLNLGAEVPPFFSRFERVLEIVHGDKSSRALSRKRFSYYKSRGYALETHTL